MPAASRALMLLVLGAMGIVLTLVSAWAAGIVASGSTSGTQWSAAEVRCRDIRGECLGRGCRSERGSHQTSGARGGHGPERRYGAQRAPCHGHAVPNRHLECRCEWRKPGVRRALGPGAGAALPALPRFCGGRGLRVGDQLSSHRAGKGCAGRRRPAGTCERPSLIRSPPR
jgi:hypothetical protein